MIVERLVTPDNISLHMEIWQPEQTPRAVVIITHGVGEHIGRYEHIIQTLTAEGCIVYGWDLRGHGKSGGERAYIDTMERVIDDLQALFRRAHRQYPDLPIYMVGHSMGATITLAFALRAQNDIAGLMLCGTPLHFHETTPPILMAAGKFVGRFLPKARLTPPIDVNGLSMNPENNANYIEDPLVYNDSLPLGTVRSLALSGEKVQAHLEELHLPLLILHGADDPIAPVSGSNMVAQKAKSEKKTVHIYEGMRHEVFNEAENEKVIEAIRQWLNEQLG